MRENERKLLEQSKEQENFPSTIHTDRRYMGQTVAFRTLIPLIIILVSFFVRQTIARSLAELNPTRNRFCRKKSSSGAKLFAHKLSKLLPFQQLSIEKHLQTY